MRGGVEGGRKVRGTAAEWESWMRGEHRRKKKKAGGREGGFSLFYVSEINYFYVCSLFRLSYR